MFICLAFCGSYFGFKRDAIEVPCKYNQIPRQIPEQQWFMHPLFSFMFGGILPFGAVFIEIYFIMSAIWMHQIYYVFGFLFIVLGILIVTCAEITIVMCYFQLCSEDYKWWWRTYHGIWIGWLLSLPLLLHVLLYQAGNYKLHKLDIVLWVHVVDIVWFLFVDW